jgi:hypothetical protein
MEWGHGDVPLLNSANMAEDFSEEPDTAVLHYFVNSDLADLEVMEHVGAWTRASMSLFHQAFFDSSNYHKATAHKIQRPNF